MASSPSQVGSASLTAFHKASLFPAPHSLIALGSRGLRESSQDRGWNLINQLLEMAGSSQLHSNTFCFYLYYISCLQSPIAMSLMCLLAASLHFSGSSVRGSVLISIL